MDPTWTPRDRRAAVSVSGLTAVTVLGLLLGTGCALDAHPAGEGASPVRAPARVTDVIDGDTIRVLAEQRELTVRLIGIDTPEKEGPYTQLECYGEEATAVTTDLLEDERVELEFDVERTDRYDRTLAYVWLDDELINETIVKEGAAVLLTIPPNVAYVERFEAAQRAARDAERGLWGACPG